MPRLTGRQTTLRPVDDRAGSLISTIAMNKPEKHKTPNYKLVTRKVSAYNPFRERMETYSVSRWEAQPLRKSRKDLP